MIKIINIIILILKTSCYFQTNLKAISIMKKITLFLLGYILFTTACNTYSVIIEPNTNTYGTACPHPAYVGTMSKSGKSMDLVSVPTSTGASKTSTISTYNQESISLYNLLADARAKYGNDVTIQNVRWDKLNKKRISVVYDVIKCN